MVKHAHILFFLTLLSACAAPSIPPSVNHITDTPRPVGNIPETIQQSTLPRPPKPTPKIETYSVSVYNVTVQSLLFAIARDAKINIDVHTNIEGNVTLNALNQTLPQLLARIAKQVDIRYQLDGNNLTVMPDTPYLRNYKVDYVNIARNTSSSVNIATQISTTGASAAGSSASSNNSTTLVANTSNNHFWETLVENIKDTLRETDKILPDTSTSNNEPVNNSNLATSPTSANARSVNTNSTANTSSSSANPVSSNNERSTTRSVYREAASVIVNAETGLIAVRATSRQHEKVQTFLDLVQSSAKRQVLIEATIIEVQLGDQYQQGINWSSLRSGTTGFNVTQGQVGTTGLPSGINPGSSAGLLVLGYANPTSQIGNISSTIQLLESFGKVKVLSSPKISVLNNQTALLKVVDNRVYFTITATTTPATTTSAAISTYTSELHTVPVGFVMTVTPQIAESDEVTLNVRPTISRIISFVQDPNPALANANTPVVSSVPVIQTREMESILKINSGQVAVMGGLMQDSVNNNKDSVPGANRLPVVGELFNYRNEAASKTELVIFLRPVVVKDASINGDYKAYRHLLPDQNGLNTLPYGEPEAFKNRDNRS